LPRASRIDHRSANRNGPPTPLHSRRRARASSSPGAMRRRAKDLRPNCAPPAYSGVHSADVRARRGGRLVEETVSLWRSTSRQQCPAWSRKLGPVTEFTAESSAGCSNDNQCARQSLGMKHALSRMQAAGPGALQHLRRPWASAGSANSPSTPAQSNAVEASPSPQPSKPRRSEYAKCRRSWGQRDTLCSPG